MESSYVAMDTRKIYMTPFSILKQMFESIESAYWYATIYYENGSNGKWPSMNCKECYIVNSTITL